MHSSVKFKYVATLFIFCSSIFLLAGCLVAQPRDVGNLKETRGQIYRDYDGQYLPVEKTAWVDWGNVNWPLIPMRYGGGYVVKIDGEQINPTHQQIHSALTERRQFNIITAAELLPGLHVFNYECTAHKGATHSFQLKAVLEAGHIYRIDCDAAHSAKSELLFATELIDVNSGVLLAGRPREALDWSWQDFNSTLQRLKNNDVNRERIFDMFLDPFWPENTAIASHFEDLAHGVLNKKQTVVYKVRPDMTGILAGDTGILRGIIVKPLPFLMGEMGLLFLKFDDADRLISYHYVALDDQKCEKAQLFPPWSDTAGLVAVGACQSFAYTLVIAEYLATTGNELGAYLAIERGLLLYSRWEESSSRFGADQFHSDKSGNAHERARQFLCTEVKKFFGKRPTVLLAAGRLFMDQEMARFQQETGTDFDVSLRKRLRIYGEFAPFQALVDANANVLLFLRR